MPLPKDHWLYAEGYNVPPMTIRVGTDDPRRGDMEDAIREAGRYALRCATMNGKDNDFDPDALLRNLIVGMLGYWTPDGFDRENAWANPPEAQATQTLPEP